MTCYTVTIKTDGQRERAGRRAPVPLNAMNAAEGSVQGMPGWLPQLRKMIEAGDEHGFYLWTRWRNTREHVLKLDNNECRLCREKGKYARGEIVHHVKHLRDRPDLALSICDEETGERQLITVCKRCHEQLHPESQRQFKGIYAPVTAERWD